MARSAKKTDKEKAYSFGIFAEHVCVLYLFFRGYRVIARRHKTKLGEIDIIASRKDHLVFFEIKARRDASNIEVLSANQRKRISQAAKLFITQNPSHSDKVFRFDLIIFNLPLSLKHIQNSWESA